MPNIVKYSLAYIMPYCIIYDMGRPRKVQQLDEKNPPTLDTKVDKINLLEALQLRYINKLSLQQIADKFGVSKQAVSQRLQGFAEKFADSEEIQLYNTNRDSLLTIAENRSTNGLSMEAAQIVEEEARDAR